MLLGQTHTLNILFNNLVMKMSSAQYLKNLEVFSRLALKAQNQQVNNRADENSEHSTNEKVEHNVDRTGTAGRTGKNTQNETMAISENIGGEKAISHERPQTWDVPMTHFSTFCEWQLYGRDRPFQIGIVWRIDYLLFSKSGYSRVHQ